MLPLLRRKVKLLLSTQEALTTVEVWCSVSSENSSHLANVVPNVFESANATTTTRSKKASDRRKSIPVMVLCDESQISEEKFRSDIFIIY
mmetsp:Transcript_13750/g.20480  ORF Transcript_13750/g.20480 Transcript_13750/m.20480 type:complete len:90 (-) Transcript_13750:22-291(-)